MTSEKSSDVVIRRATPPDAAVCGRICFDAFFSINQKHGFPCDFPDPSVPTGLLNMLFSAPPFYCVVAEVEGRIVGSNCLDERSVIHGIGPITIDPAVQNRGIGRKLMQAVMQRSHEQGAVGLRLVQAGFHMRSLSLYASLGFEIREPLACMQGRTEQRTVAGCSVRAATASDIVGCAQLSSRVHGFDRTGELPTAIQAGTAKIVEREGRITAYTNDLAFFGHATAETVADLQSLLCSADSFGGPGVLIPTRNTALFRWCLQNGLRVVQPLTLMSMGLYNEPAGAWLPSILY